jgi:hypothetical protein
MPVYDVAQTSAVRLLKKRLEESGMHINDFAKLLIRNERTVRRWLDGDSPIPQVVVDFLKTYKAA